MPITDPPAVYSEQIDRLRARLLAASRDPADYCGEPLAVYGRLRVGCGAATLAQRLAAVREARAACRGGER